eukprot:COSAG03_NODE_6806_length_1003_cov_0.987832_1_plen_108_part_10
MGPFSRFAEREAYSVHTQGDGERPGERAAGDVAPKMAEAYKVRRSHGGREHASAHAPASVITLAMYSLEPRKGGGSGAQKAKATSTAGRNVAQGKGGRRRPPPPPPPP